MTGNPDRYSVAPHELEQVVADLVRCERTLEQLTDELEAQITRLHDQWEGLAATAQREAYQTWQQGMDAMRASLAQMHAAGSVAHDNYAKAVATNVSMWDGLR